MEDVKALALDVALYETVLGKINEAVYVIDSSGKIVFANKAAELLEGVAIEEIIGETVTELARFTEHNEKWIPPSIQVLKNGKALLDQNIEWYSRDGNGVNAILSNYPILKKDKTIGVISICENIKVLKKRLSLIGGVNRKKMYLLRKHEMNNGTIYIFDDIIGKSKSMENSITMAKRFAMRKMPIMIYGETGTGKEMFAQSIHNASAFAKGQFVAINCAAIPETLLESILFGTSKGAFTGALNRPGLFEKAEKGTIFLDEINSMPLTLQSKFLRALQEKEVQRIGDNQMRKINCRILSATNRLPAEAISNGELREDLFYRLSTGMIFLPPLRERGKDLELLIDFFIEKVNVELDTTISGISDMLKKLFESYYWPGNIRELSNIIESTMNMTFEGDFVLELHHIPSYLKNNFFDELSTMPNASQIFEHYNLEGGEIQKYQMIGPNLSLSNMVGQYEKGILEQSLAGTKGNLTRCSKKLGITRQGLMKKVQKYEIDLTFFKGAKKSD